MNQNEHILIYKNIRVLEPFLNINERKTIIFDSNNSQKVQVLDTISELPEQYRSLIQQIVEDDYFLCPGLIDFHTHIYQGCTSLGVDPAELAKRSGCTTLVDAGSSGAGNFEGLKKYIIEQNQKINIKAFLNISFAGIYGFGESIRVGECWQEKLMDIEECVSCVLRNTKYIIGLKVRIGTLYGPGIEPLKIAIKAAEQISQLLNIPSFPIMCHIDFEPPTRLEIVELLRPGDILTHCWRPTPINSDEQQIRQAMKLAREKYIYWDLGHGQGSFSFEISKQWIEKGQFIDTLSSDIHKFNENGPVYDNLHVMSKLLCLGMPLSEIINSVTLKPAKIINKQSPDTYSIMHGNATILKVTKGHFSYKESDTPQKQGQTIIGDKKFELISSIINCKIYS